MASEVGNEWSLTAALRRQVQQRREDLFASFHDGRALTYGALEERSDAVAAGLARLNVGPGDRVLILAHNSVEFLVALLATHKRRAILVAVNVELHGELLEHQVRNSKPAVIIVDERLKDRIDGLSSPAPAGVRQVVIGNDGHEPQRCDTMSFDDLSDVEMGNDAVLEPAGEEIAMILYTSGTSGSAKGVLMPQAHCYLFGQLLAKAQQVTAGDVFYVSMPMYHVNALLMSIGCCLIVGARVHVARRFSASHWLSEIRACGATVTNTLGVMPEYILAQPPKSDDRDHSLSRMMAVPVSASLVEAFQARFGVRLVQMYGMTECNIVAHADPQAPTPPGCSGPVVSDFFDVRIADPETDVERPVNQIGEILVRPRRPGCFMQGYAGKPEETVRSWRNLWFHTGDAGHLDEAGRLYFVDRLRDCIRRRGENISPYDVEQAINAHPAVKESAAVGVKVVGAGGEEEVMACVVLSGPLEAVDLVDWCVQRLPRFSVPRFVRFLDRLEKTTTGKVKKGSLRDAGVTEDTWDREEAGYTLPR
jgi:crotonobetaine/carnitine-CoA ligase